MYFRQPFGRGHGRDRMTEASLGLQRGRGTPPLQLPTDDDFFRTEATNILKRKDDNPGPNPTRTHFGNGENKGREDAPPGPTPTLQHGRRLGQFRYTQGCWWRERRRTTANERWFFQDRSHQYVETKGRHPGTNPIRTHFRKPKASPWPGWVATCG